MFRHGYLVTCLVAFLLSDTTVARAGPFSEGRPTTADSLRPLSHAIEEHVLQLSRIARATSATRLLDDTQTATRIRQLPSCQSKKKGALIGAAIGAAAGAAVAVYVVRGVGGVLGASNGASRYIAYWTIGGAGAGAVGGLVYCLTS